MQTRPFPSTPDARSPAGAEIRYLMEGETGNMIHSTVPPGQVNRATVHATVSEFWHVLSGEGQIWRRDAAGEETTVLERGVSIDIPVGTAFQYRCDGVEPLTFLCVSMPPWPGNTEATIPGLMAIGEAACRPLALTPFTFAESEAYISARRPDASPAQMQVVHRRAEGNPRVIANLIEPDRNLVGEALRDTLRHRNRAGIGQR